MHSTPSVQMGGVQANDISRTAAENSHQAGVGNRQGTQFTEILTTSHSGAKKELLVPVVSKMW